MEIIVVSIITGVFTVISIMLLNHNWFKRRELEYNLKIAMKKMDHTKAKKMIELKQKTGGMPINKVPNIQQYLGLLKMLDPDQLKNLLTAVTGEEEEGIAEVPEGLQGLALWAMKNPAVQGLIRGITEKLLSGEGVGEEEVSATEFIR